MSEPTIYVILVAHFVADFVCQSDWMAINKSRNTAEGVRALLSHVILYAAILCVAVAALPGESTSLALLWIAVNFGAHLGQDAITSRINAKLWAANQRHWFFVCIGADQLLHYLTLFITGGWWLQ